MKTGKIFLTSILFFCFATNTFAQDCLRSSGVLIKAMNDEIKRNLERLREDDFDKPFFIGYSVSDIRFNFSLATLGAVVNSAETRNRSWNARVIVGDYHINDENFSNSFQGNSYDPGYETLPLENDYWGIRRVFWIATNNIYKSAARNYAQKIKTLEENNVDYPLADFSKETSVKHYDTSVYKHVELPALEKLTKDISVRFRDYPSFVNSGAYASNTSSVNYFVNSEGTEIQTPGNIASLYINASALGKKNVPRSFHLQYLASSFEALPSIEDIHKDIDIVAESALKSDEIKNLEDDYSGPVLLEGQAVAEFFIANLLNSGEDGIIAGRKPMTNANKKAIEKYFEDLQKEMEKDGSVKIGPGFLNVKAFPFLKSFRDQALLGSFAIDGEGVAPSEELTIVEKGVLKTKLNGRTSAVNVERSNGYKRRQISGSGASFAIAPGVLMVSSDKVMSYDSIKHNLGAAVEEEGLDFGIVVRPLAVSASSKPIEYIKVKGQTEEQLNVAYVNYKKKNALKKIVAVSDDLIVYNFMYRSGGGFLGSNMFTDGVPTTIIVPAAILLKDFDINSYKGNDEAFEPTIKGPHE